MLCNTDHVGVTALHAPSWTFFISFISFLFVLLVVWRAAPQHCAFLFFSFFLFGFIFVCEKDPQPNRETLDPKNIINPKR